MWKMILWRDLVSGYLEKIDILSLHPKNKINIVTKFVYSKLRLNLTIYYLPNTWIAENLDNKVKVLKVWKLKILLSVCNSLVTFIDITKSL